MRQPNTPIHRTLVRTHILDGFEWSLKSVANWNGHGSDSHEKVARERKEKVCKRVNFCCWTWLMDGELGSGRADSGGMTAVTP